MNGFSAAQRAHDTQQHPDFYATDHTDQIISRIQSDIDAESTDEFAESLNPSQIDLVYRIAHLICQSGSLLWQPSEQYIVAEEIIKTQQQLIDSINDSRYESTLSAIVDEAEEAKAEAMMERGAA